MTGPAGAATILLEAPIPSTLPSGRGRWRLSLHARQFDNATANATLISELTNARSRRLEKALNKPAVLTFTVDGRGPTASLMRELQHDVYAWRWDDAAERDVPYFRGVIAQTEDEISEQRHTVNVTVHDYFDMVKRRWTTRALDWSSGFTADAMGVSLLKEAVDFHTSSGESLAPGSYLPLVWTQCDPNGDPRGVAMPVRVRNYAGQQNIGEAIENLAAVINGFDFDVFQPGGDAPADQLRAFYPQQGIDRPGVVLEYGGAVAAVTRVVNSADYANYWRVVGNNASTDPNAPQLFSEAWNDDANNVTIPDRRVGLWQDVDSPADVSEQATLDQVAQGNLKASGILVPHYTLTLRPDVFAHGFVNMGDTVPIVIRSGRLDVASAVRVVGINFDITDDGSEDVELVVGRPLPTMSALFAKTASTVDALARR